MKEYNGYKNYQTWNVALWINNDKGLQQWAAESETYDVFRQRLLSAYGGDYASIGNSIAICTPDGVAWNDSGLDIVTLDQVIKDCHD